MKSDEMRNELVSLGGGAHVLATQILGDVDDAADAVHDALATALGRPDAYDARKGPLKPWFLRMVRNRCIDLLRKRRPTDDLVEQIVDSSVGPEQAAEDADRDRILKLALAALDSDQRQIIVLRDYMDLTYAGIVEVLGIAPGTVMSRLHRARVALREAYKKECNEERNKERNKEYKENDE
jgi:RNA polymerase sigma-70 factor (ECF subfamily)